VVTENFAAGVLERLGFGYEALRAITPDIIYVSNCGFGHQGPYREFKTWGPIVQAMSGLTFSSGLAGREPAGWGYSYMDHTGGYYMAMGILLALIHRNRTGEGQWVDMACTEAGATLNGPALLDYTVNGRKLRRPGMPNSNRNQYPEMAPHGIYPSATEDTWIGITCRSDDEWRAFAKVVDRDWVNDERFRALAGRIQHQDDLDRLVGEWTAERDNFRAAAELRAASVPATAVQSPEQRIDQDENTAAFGLWPTVKHTEMGELRVDGMPVHFSKTDWCIERGAPCLGEHNQQVFSELLGLSDTEIGSLRKEGVI
jgi:crotonobetainyl-CoA:carnitine CoA-transferase CaiB-like acyl-CoA transferase